MAVRRGRVATVQDEVREVLPTSEAVAWLLGLAGVRAVEGQVVGVLRGEQLLGVAVLRVGGPEAEISTLVIDPNHRHRGVARRLVRDLALRARAAGCRRLYVRLPRAFDASVGFFRALGFEETHLTLDLRL